MKKIINLLLVLTITLSLIQNTFADNQSEIYKSNISDLSNKCIELSTSNNPEPVPNSCYQNKKVTSKLYDFLNLIKSNKIDDAISILDLDSFNFNIEGITKLKAYKKYNNGILFIDFYNGGGDLNIDMYEIGYIKPNNDIITVYKNKGLFGKDTQQYKDYIILYGLGGYSSYNPNGYGWSQEFEDDIIKAFNNNKFNNKSANAKFLNILQDIDKSFGSGNSIDNIQNKKLLILNEKQKSSIEKSISKLNKDKLEKLISKIDLILSQKKNLSEKQKNIYKDVKTIIQSNSVFNEVINKKEDINNKSFGKNFKSENGIIYFLDTQMSTWRKTDIDIDSFELFDDYYGRDKYGFFNGNIRLIGGTKNMWYKGKGLFIDQIENKIYSIGYDYSTLQELKIIADANTYTYEGSKTFEESNKCKGYSNETSYDSYDSQFCYSWTSRIDIKKVGEIIK